MRDGVRLATDVYLPSLGGGPWPTILVRTPYGKETSLDAGLVVLITDIQKYILAVQDTRGRFDSEGADSLFFHDGWGRVQDGYDTVEWIAVQPWSDGKVGTWGLSALGITQYLLAGAAPPHLSCCYVMTAASNLYEDALFYGGAYRRSLVDGWLQDTDSEHLLDFFYTASELRADLRRPQSFHTVRFRGRAHIPRGRMARCLHTGADQCLLRHSGEGRCESLRVSEVTRGAVDA